MAAITTPKQRRMGLHTFRKIGLPVKADTNIPAGALVVTDANALAENGTDNPAKTFQGVCTQGYDNRGGADGVVGDTASDRHIEVDRNGQWEITVSAGQPEPGASAYLVDNDTVSASATANNILVGTFAQPGRPGSWYIDIQSSF